MRKEYLLFLVLLFGICWADVTVSYQVYPASSLPPGSNGMVGLSIVNSGTDSVSLNLYTRSATKIKSQEFINVGELRSGAMTLINIPFSIDNSVPSGVYTLYIQLVGMESGSGSATKIERWVHVPIIVEKPLSLSASISPNDFEQGSSRDVELTLLNSGEKITNCEIIINGTDVKLDGASAHYIGDLEGEKKINLTFSISDTATSGRVNAPIYLKYTHALGTTRTEKINVPIQIKERSSAFLVFMNDTSLMPNTKNEVHLQVKNKGDNIAKDVVITISDDSVLIPLSESAISVGTLLPGEVKTIKVSLAVKDVTLGYYNIPFSISYNGENNKPMAPETKSVGVYISSPPAIDAYIVTSPSPIVSGKTHTFSIQATNIGVSDIKSLTVNTKSNNVFKILDAESEQFIGSLRADDFSTVQYKVFVSVVESGEYPLEFEIKYLDMSNNPQTINIVKPLNVYSAEESSSFAGNGSGLETYCISGIVILVLIGVVYYIFFRKNRKV
ncbi:hypothetical protein KO465_03380 [Candidatus Micrarchaeota archaeon]|jgi:hypothetical protein|nr:hypothetical protein [Candidatus Micrarchaeota archaeon]